MIAVSRRRFLRTAGCAALGAALAGPDRALANLLDRGGPLPEYAGDLGEMLFVYDQVRATHLLREIVEIVRHAPAKPRLHVLVSAALEDEARERLAAYGLRGAAFMRSSAMRVSGDWGRDILQVARDPDGVRVAHVPWNKAAASRAELRRGAEQMAPLAREDLRVRLLPAAWEGGNLMTDVTADGRRVLFAGSTIALETAALYRRWHSAAIGPREAGRILGDALGCDEVVWIGPRDAEGRLERQPHLLFHIDMGMTLVAPGVAVVARLDPENGWQSVHRDLLLRELERTREALAKRRRAGLETGTNPSLPEPGAESGYLDAKLAEERALLSAAAHHLDDTAGRLIARGYHVHRVDTEPERARRFQSYTNVIPARDRMIVPIYPAIERVHGWVVPGPGGRDRVDIDTGPEDSDFRLEGGNLRAVEFYRGLHPDVRVVRDYFYMASGNVHCVIGRLG
jgi:hypothetical protein